MEQRLIDANALFSAIEEMDTIGTMDNENDAAISQSKVLDIVFAAPTVDAVPVVRCKECVWRHDDSSPIWLPCMSKDTDDDWFCADGERK